MFQMKKQSRDISYGRQKHTRQIIKSFTYQLWTTETYPENYQIIYICKLSNHLHISYGHNRTYPATTMADDQQQLDQRGNGRRPTTTRPTRKSATEQTKSHANNGNNNLSSFAGDLFIKK